MPVNRPTLAVATTTGDPDRAPAADPLAAFEGRGRAAPPPEEPARRPPRVAVQKRVGRKKYSLRLDGDAWAQLHHLAVNEDSTAHELLLEALNMLFKHRRLPPLAK